MMAPKAPYLASAAILYNSRGRSPQPACKAKPITGRTLAAQGQRPGGWLNRHARKGVLTFWNTGKHPVPIPTAPQAPEPSSPKGACPVTHKKIHPIRDGFFFISLPFSGLLYLSPLSFLSFLQPVLHILPLSLPVLSLYTRRSRGPGRREGPGGWPRRGRR